MDQTSLVENFDKELVKDILLQHYGIPVTGIKLLLGYEQPNILIYVENDAENPSYILKATTDDKNNEEVVQTTMNLQYQLWQSELPVPLPVRTLSKTWIQKAEFGARKERYLLWLLTFIPGEILTNVNVTQPQLDSIAHQCGLMFAKLDRKLMDISRGKKLERIDFQWSIANDQFCKKKLHFIDDDELRSACAEIDKAFDDYMISNLPNLRPGLLHGDGNEANIVVTCEDALKENDMRCDVVNWKLTGIIDFGDLYEGKIVFEIATLMAYMMNKAWHNNLDPEKAAEMALNGFNRILPLNKEEQDVLYICVLKRMITSICSSSYEKKLGCHEQISKDLSSMSGLVKMMWKKSNIENKLFHPDEMI